MVYDVSFMVFWVIRPGGCASVLLNLFGLGQSKGVLGRVSSGFKQLKAASKAACLVEMSASSAQ